MLFLATLELIVRRLAQGILAWRQHIGLTPTSVVLKSHTVAQSMLNWNIYTEQNALRVGGLAGWRVGGLAGWRQSNSDLILQMPIDGRYSPAL